MDPASSGVILLGILTFARGFFALARTALVNSHRTKLRQLAEEGVKGAAWAERVAEDSTRLLITVQFGQTLFSLLAAATAAVIFSPLLAVWIGHLQLASVLVNSLSVLIVTGLVAILVLLFGDKLPEAMALRDPEGISLSIAWIIHLFSIPFTPVVRLVMRISQILVGTEAGDYAGLALVTEEEIKTLVDAGQEEGVIEEDEKAMIYSIFRFGHTSTREVMVPRIDVIAVEINTPPEEALRVIVDAGHSRIPVYRENIDNIQGILYAKDFLELWLPGNSVERDQPLASLLRPAHYIPESKMLDDLLAEMQQRKVHIAIVVDEYGGTAGIVTIEDILEEIVGEIQDEYDSEEASYKEISQDEFIFNARIDLDDVNELLGCNLPTEQGDTLGGFIYSQLGKVPAPGEVIHFDGYSIEVISVLKRRIQQVRVRRHTASQDNQEDKDI
ncbi:MAG: HlyC/CorC family transporter [Anaerolineales bacterium]|nr:HlyC/CorC family transporter [Anaerolineales bacterium]